MKKITSLLSLALIASAGFAQSNFETAKQTGDATATTVAYETQTAPLAPCTQQVLGTYENGWGPTNNADIIWADDFSVSAGESFTVNQITLSMLTNPGSSVSEADIIFYADTGNGPGAEIEYLSMVEVASDDIVGAAFGFDARNIVFDIDPITFSGDEGTVYWVGFITDYAGANSYFEVTTIVNTENEVYVFDATEGFWIPGRDAFTDPQDPSDLVMTVSGECNVLSVQDNLLSQVSIYPNPATSVINLKTPSNVDVKSVVLFDTLGKRVNASFSNGTINVSSLAQGIYLLKVETSAGTLTQKIVKQ